MRWKRRSQMIHLDGRWWEVGGGRTSTCSSRGEARADGTARNQPRACRAVAEEKGAPHRRTCCVCCSRKPSTWTLAGPLKRVLLQPAWCCQRWGIAEAAEVSVRWIWRVSTQSKTQARTWSDARCASTGRCETRFFASAFSLFSVTMLDVLTLICVMSLIFVFPLVALAA